MEMLSDEALGACSTPSVAIVLARVTAAEIDAAGTRSEAAVLEVAVERTLCGRAPATLSVWRWTSGGDTVLVPGRKYLVVCRRGPGLAPYGLGHFVPVPEAEESAIVAAHLAALKRLQAKGR